MANKVGFNNPYYPYEKVQQGFNTLHGAEDIPYQILMYLLDLPDRSGYEPVDDNSRPRVRLIKYLWYDEPNPLSMPLPTPEEKLSLVYNGENPDINTDEAKRNHPKGYRIFTQQYELQSQTQAKTILRCFMGREIPRSDYKTILGLNFSCIVDYALEDIISTNIASRMYAIHQCLIESLHGVNISGIGVIYYDKNIHGDCGRTTYHTEGNFVYDDTFMAIEWQETTTDEIVQDWM